MGPISKNKSGTITLVIALWIITFSVTAQQDPLTAQYLNNYFIINPAYAGMTKDLNLSAGYRSQWAGFSGSPVTLNVNGHVSLAANKMGVGLNIVQDKLGSNKTTEVNAAYSYHVPLKEGVEFSFGLQAGVINFRSDYGDLQIDRSDPKFNNVSEYQPNFGAGVLVRSEKYFVSVAMPHMLKASGGPESLATNSYARNLYLFGGYVVPLSYRIKFRPSVLVRYVKDMNASIDYFVGIRIDDSYTIGIFTRNFNTLGFQAQLNVGNALRFMYVFELPMHSNSNLNFTSHEFMVSFRLGVLSFHNLTDVRSF